MRRPALVAVAVFVVALPLLALRSGNAGSPDRLTGPAAAKAAIADPAIHRYLARSGYTRTDSIPLDNELMRVSFFRGSRIVLDAAVAPNGSVPHSIQYRPGYVRAGTKDVQTPLALVLLSLVFALAVGCVPLRRLRNLDVLALLSFAVSIVLLNQRLFEPSVYVAYPPLAYLGFRCLRVALGARQVGPSRAERPVYEALVAKWNRARQVRMLRVLVFAAALALVIASVPGGSVGDVGFASIAGATQLLHGHLPYGHLPPELVHGDTYPLLAYALYVPAALFMPVRDAFDNLDGALLVSTAATLIAAVGVYRAAASRQRGGTERGLRHALAWLVFPPVLITASSGSNDMVAAACVAWAIATLAHPRRSTALMTLAGWIKLIPFFALPLLVARLRLQRIAALGAAATVSVAVLGWIVILGGTHGVRLMLDGVSFQAERGSLLSIWTLLGIKPLQLALQAAVLSLVVVSPLLVLRDQALARDHRRLVALSGAILIGFQLAANYWSYAYLPWVLPFVMFALLTGPTTEAYVSRGMPLPPRESRRSRQAIAVS